MVDNHARFEICIEWYTMRAVCGDTMHPNCNAWKSECIFYTTDIWFDVAFMSLHRKALFSTLSRKNIIIENVAVNVLPRHVMPIQWFHFPSQHDSHISIQRYCESIEHLLAWVCVCVYVNTAWPNMISIWIDVFCLIAGVDSSDDK